MPTYMTPEIERQIISLYTDGKSASQILEVIDIFKTTKTIYDVLKKHNIPTKKLTDYAMPKNDDFFDSIDSHAKAYALGLIITDGWVTQNSNHIGFSNTEKSLTEFIRNKISPKSNITIISAKPYVIMGNEVNRKQAYQVQICSSLLKLGLDTLGVRYNKTGNEFIPHINREYHSSLLAGIIDGDGCVYQLSNKKQAGIYICSASNIFLEQIRQIIYLNNRFLVRSPYKGEHIYRLDISRRKDVSLFGRWVWSKAPLKSSKYYKWKNLHYGKDSNNHFIG